LLGIGNLIFLTCLYGWKSSVDSWILGKILESKN